MLTGLASQSALLVSGVLSARLLGVEDRGHLALFGLFPIVLAQIGGLGLPLAATYHIARDPTRTRAVVRALGRFALVQIACLLVVHAAILAAVVGTSEKHVLVAGVISLLSLPAIFLQQYALAVLQGQGRFRVFNTLRLLPVILYAAGILAAAVAGADRLEVVTAIWVVAYIVAASWTVAIAARSLGDHGESRAPPVKEMLGFGMKGLLGSASPVETFRLDQAVVGLLLSPAALGVYVVGMAFTNLPRFLAQSVGVVAYPTVAARDPTAGRRAMWRFLWLVLAMSTVVVAAIQLAIGWLVPLLFGPDFGEAVPIARILLLGALFLSVRRVLSDCARGLGQPAAGTIAELMSWTCLVPALAILTPLFGVIGVAWALTLSSAVSAGSLTMILVVSPRRSRAAGKTTDPADRDGQSLRQAQAPAAERDTLPESPIT